MTGIKVSNVYIKKKIGRDLKPGAFDFAEKFLVCMVGTWNGSVNGVWMQHSAP